MEFNFLIFPSPKCSYTEDSKNLLWISRQSSQNSKQYSNFRASEKMQKQINPTDIPCLYLPYTNSNKIIIYFHANAEDLGTSYAFLTHLRKQLKINILAVEYPGYGLYKGSPNSQQILQDSEYVYDYIKHRLNIQNVYVFGRSIGSGPACYLASIRKIDCLILMCPYTSIKDVVEQTLGSILASLVSDRFRNIDYITKVSCPTLIIHGKQDKIINYQQSLNLLEKINTDQSFLHLSPQMTHNQYDIMMDVIIPITNFFMQCQIIN